MVAEIFMRVPDRCIKKVCQNMKNSIFEVYFEEKWNTRKGKLII